MSNFDYTCPAVEVLATLEEETVEILITQIMAVREVVVVATAIMIITEAVVVARIEDLVAVIEEIVDHGRIIRRPLVVIVV